VLWRKRQQDDDSSSVADTDAGVNQWPHYKPVAWLVAVLYI